MEMITLTANNDNANISPDTQQKCVEMVEMCPNLPLANAYVPFQKYNKIYPMNEGLYNGTIFPDLNMPYIKEDPNYKPKKKC
jgi:hypothetical protein